MRIYGSRLRSMFGVNTLSIETKTVGINLYARCYKYIETPALTIYIWWDEMRKLTFNRNTNMPPDPLSMLSACPTACLPAFDGQKLKRHRKNRFSGIVVVLSCCACRTAPKDLGVLIRCDAMREREWVRVWFLSIKQHTTRCANACLKCMN